MRLSTKTVASLLVSATLAVRRPQTRDMQTPTRLKESQFDRLLHRHDRKGELQADLLGLPIHEFRHMQRTMNFDDIIKRSGMDTYVGFCLAVVGKLRDELHRRGWSRARIDAYIARRMQRGGSTLQVA